MINAGLIIDGLVGVVSSSHLSVRAHGSWLMMDLLILAFAYSDLKNNIVNRLDGASVNSSMMSSLFVFQSPWRIVG